MGVLPFGGTMFLRVVLTRAVVTGLLASPGTHLLLSPSYFFGPLFSDGPQSNRGLVFDVDMVVEAARFGGCLEYPLDEIDRSIQHVCSNRYVDLFYRFLGDFVTVRITHHGDDEVSPLNVFTFLLLPWHGVAQPLQPHKLARRRYYLGVQFNVLTDATQYPF